MKKQRIREQNAVLAVLLGICLIAGVGCRRHKHQALDITESAEPDKILYEKSVEDIGNHRWTVARLTLQTLMSTYPESVYLADAKLAMADSYYEEGTTSSLAHAEIEYKDYITFFPTSPEAPRAQYSTAMVHFRQLELPDRDKTHAERAEKEFQILLKKYPDSEYAVIGETKLLEVQEVLAEGQFRVGRFYFVRGSVWSATPRLAEAVERYPNFSKRDEALWMLYRAYSKADPLRNWRVNDELAGDYLLRIVREHTLSDRLEQAKKELVKRGLPVPEPDPAIVARAQTIQPVGEKVKGPSLLGRMFGRFSGRPDTSAAAARLGPPPLEPPANLSTLPYRQIRSGQGQNSATVKTVDPPPKSGNPPPKKD